MIKREILNKIKPWLGKEKILIIKGSRQVGKTTILKQLKEKLMKNEAKVVYLLADDFENQNILKSPANLELYLKQFHNFPNNYTYLMIDEFQVIEQAGLFLKNIFDKHKDKMQIIVSGSSSLEITKNSEFLTGRSIDFNINRINFKEYFDFINQTETEKINIIEIEKLTLFYQTFKNKLDLNLVEYLVFGGYPEVITTQNIEDKKIILKSILKTYIEKDIINFLKIDNVSGFNNLTKILSSQIGNLVNINELTNTVNIATNTLKKYLDILVGTYVFNLMTPFYQNIRSEITKMPKVYILDFGLMNYLLKTFNTNTSLNDLENAGAIMENFVYLTLLNNIQKDYIHFYRTRSGAEIDFIIEKENGGKILCEVKYRSKIKEPLPMKNFEKKYPEMVKQKIIVTKDLLKKDNDVFYIPASLFPFVEF